MRVLLCLALFFAAMPQALAQTAPSPSRPHATIHHQVSSDPRAQAAFDRGLLDYYAYNPEAAEHEFYTAADLDKHLAMAWWGIAISNGPNLNVPPNDDRDNQARRAIGHAKDLESYASPEDRALIDAAFARFADSTKAGLDALQAAYAEQLKAVATANPGDPDAAALYAEAALYVAAAKVRDYETMTPDQRAAFRAGIAALLPFYQSELATFPKHVGLLHFYIHAAQMAGTSQVAVTAAHQLAAFELPPEDSHLTHMPGHTFFDVGLYADGLDVGRRSVAMDFADIDCCHPGYYSAVRYYHRHNVSFVLYALTQTGNTAEAVAVAQRENDGTFIAEQLVAAGRWKEAAALAPVKGNWYVTFARGLASAKLDDRAEAQAALDSLPASAADSPFRSALLSALRATLAAEVALLDRDDEKALSLLQSASAASDTAQQVGTPEMPVMYFYSPYMALADLAMHMGKTDIARQALQAELVASPRSSAALAQLAKLNATR